jgi:hypothetical protein
MFESIRNDVIAGLIVAAIGGFAGWFWRGLWWKGEGYSGPQILLSLLVLGLGYLVLLFALAFMVGVGLFPDWLKTVFGRGFYIVWGIAVKRGILAALIAAPEAARRSVGARPASASLVVDSPHCCSVATTGRQHDRYTVGILYTFRLLPPILGAQALPCSQAGPQPADYWLKIQHFLA